MIKSLFLGVLLIVSYATISKAEADCGKLLKARCGCIESSMTDVWICMERCYSRVGFCCKSCLECGPGIPCLCNECNEIRRPTRAPPVPPPLPPFFTAYSPSNTVPEQTETSTGKPSELQLTEVDIQNFFNSLINDV